MIFGCYVSTIPRGIIASSHIDGVERANEKHNEYKKKIEKQLIPYIGIHDHRGIVYVDDKKLDYIGYERMAGITFCVVTLNECPLLTCFGLVNELIHNYSSNNNITNVNLLESIKRWHDISNPPVEFSQLIVVCQEKHIDNIKSTTLEELVSDISLHQASEEVDQVGDSIDQNLINDRSQRNWSRIRGLCVISAVLLFFFIGILFIGLMSQIK